MDTRVEAGLDRMRIGRKGMLVVAAVLVALLFLAWFDGGEQPVKPIVQDIEYAGDEA